MTNLRKLFWEKYTLDQLNSAEWEALCDGCAKCCLLKITDEKNIFITNISCTKLKVDSCRCSDYPNREKNVKFLPSSCSYRLIAEGKPLPRWHYLISNEKERVHKLNHSIQSYCVSEAFVEKENYEDHILAEITEE